MPSTGAKATVSGLAVLTGVTGSVLLWSGLKNQPVAETLRKMIRGQAVDKAPSQFGAGARLPLGPASAGPTGPTPPGGTSFGMAVAATARSYVGVPYVFGGETPDGWDCSGFVTWVLHTVHGVKLPNNVHTIAAQFYIWGGARTILRSQCSPGDLVCWPTHIGIAISRDRLVHAPGLGQKTREQGIWAGAVIRRPMAYGEG